MKKIVLAAAAAVTAVAFAGTTFAADLPARYPAKAPAAIVVATSWTGCYIGGGGGYGMWNQENTPYDDVLGVPLGPQTTNGGRGYFGTGQVGCDYQLAAKWVVGAFGDGDYGELKGNVGALGFFGQEKMTWSWSAGGRVGYLVTPQFLTYFSGGYTQAHFDRTDFSVFGGGPAGVYAPAHTFSGYFLGSGYEYAIDFVPGLFWKTEYRFADYSADRIPILFSATGLSVGASVDSHKYVQTIRSALVWRFNFFR